MAFKLSLPLKPKPKSKPKKAPPAPQTPSYHSVSIRCGPSACAAAIEAKSQRHLASDAPILPLQGCDQQDRCECSYRHYEDRRAGPRRKSEGAAPSQSSNDTPENRTITGRRADDRPGFSGVEPEQDDELLEADTYYGFFRKRQ